jgi:DNA repair protein RecO (recombination protein O)
MDTQPTCEPLANQPPERARERLYRTEGIVIRRIDLGEADKILIIYTPTRGKVRAIAKGIRRPESHLGGNVELFVQARLLLARGRDLDIVTQAESIEPFKGLRDNLLRLQCGFYFGELLDSLTDDGLANDAVYALLRDCLAALADRRAPGAIIRFYELSLLRLLGFGLEIGRCVQCRRPLEPVENLISIQEGGVICPNCRSTDATARPLSVNALKLLRLIANQPLSSLLRYRLPAAAEAELEAISRASLLVQLEHEPRSWPLLAAALADAEGHQTVVL